MVQKNQDALLEFSKHCFSLADVADDVLAALAHKMPKVPQQTLLWIATAAREMNQHHRDDARAEGALPGCSNASTRLTRTSEPPPSKPSRGWLSGGEYKSVARAVDELDDAKKAKIEEMCAQTGGRKEGGATGPAPLQTRNPNVASVPAATLAAAKTAASRSGPTGPLTRPSAAAPKRSVAAASGAASGVVGSYSEADADVAEGAPASKEELVERASRLYAADVVAKLQSSNWKERVEGVAAVVAAVDAMSDEDAGAAAGDTIRALACFPGFAEKVVLVLAQVFEVFGSLAAKAPKFSKHDGAIAVQGLAEKIADVKLRAPASAALTAVAEALGPKFVMAQLHKRTASHKNPKVTAESLLWCAGAVEEFNVAVVDVSFVIAWCKRRSPCPTPRASPRLARFSAPCAGLGPGLKDFLADPRTRSSRRWRLSSRVTLTSAPRWSARGRYERMGRRGRPSRRRPTAACPAPTSPEKSPKN